MMNYHTLQVRSAFPNSGLDQSPIHSALIPNNQGPQFIEIIRRMIRRTKIRTLVILRKLQRAYSE